MSDQKNTFPPVDLVIVIDTSPSMQDEAKALSKAATVAIDAAKSSCPSDLRVAWFGIEGTWKETKFDRPLRNYLLQECHVPESNIRQRKRGELASAGAQEDAARAIEDISDHFDWRSGAARAIFYLGDEALEGGGDKTEQEDIEAANLAIQKANAAGVTIHTYFGTSKSKHRGSIASEYARVAAATGGQAFTDQDAISGFATVLERVICGSRASQSLTAQRSSGTVYVQDYAVSKPSKLYTLDLSTGRAILIGEIATEVYDITFVGETLYGLDKKDFSIFQKTMKLVKVDPATGKPESIGDTGFDVVGLAYNPVRQTLYATAHENHQLIAIDLETGKGSVAATLSDRDRNCGEIAFDANGTAYITLIGTDLQKFLATCNLDTGEVTVIGDTGFPGLASMEFIGDTLYGVAGYYSGVGGADGQLICIDTTTGKGTLIAMTEPLGRWAGITVGTPISQTSASARLKETPQPEKAVDALPQKIPGTREIPQPQQSAGAVAEKIPQPQQLVGVVGAEMLQPQSKKPTDDTTKPPQPTVVGNLDTFLTTLAFDRFERNPATDVVCVTPVRTIVRREEEITIIRRVRKVEEVDASPACPINTTQVSQVQQEK